MRCNIAIAGGGLLGRLTAWRLLLAGHQVRLFEAGSLQESPSAAATAAGMVSPLAELVDSEASIYHLGMRSLALWANWLTALPTGSPLLHQQGSLVVAHGQDKPELRHFLQTLARQQAPRHTYQHLDRAGVLQLEPALQSFNEGLFLATEAHLDNQQLLAALLQAIIALGGDCVEHCPVSEITNTMMITSCGSVHADWHLDCRGLGAKASLSGLRGVRGEVLWVHTPELQLQRPVRLLHPRYKLYIVPKPNQQFIIGATEIESEDRSPMSVQSNLELASALYSINPAFAEARVIKSDVNLRPALMDNLPRLYCDNGYASVNGLYRHGYLLAPALVEDLVNQIQLQSSSLSAAMPEDFQPL